MILIAAYSSIKMRYYLWNLQRSVKSWIEIREFDRKRRFDVNGCQMGIMHVLIEIQPQLIVTDCKKQAHGN